MPKNKDLKRLIRARMEKTGESYTTARIHLLSDELPLPRDYEKVAGMSDAAVGNATGRDWRAWTDVLDAVDAAEWPHARIARWLAEEHGVAGWWSQAVTVAYERFRGLREPGQRRGGAYDVGRSRTVAVPVERLKEAFRDPELRARWLRDLQLEHVPNRSKKSLRFRTPEGRTVVGWFDEKAERKASVGIQIEGLESREAADAEREAWGARLDALKALLEAES